MLLIIYLSRRDGTGGYGKTIPTFTETRIENYYEKIYTPIRAVDRGDRTDGGDFQLFYGKRGRVSRNLRRIHQTNT